MTRIGNILIAVLAAQLLLAVALFWPRQEAGQALANSSLLTLANVDRIEVSDADNTVLLMRERGEWTMPDYHGLSVNPSRITMVLDTLPEHARGWPVANSASAATRFEVAEDNFQRRVEYFRDGDSVGLLYLGTSPGFRKIHTRLEDEDAIYAVEFNSFDAPVEAAEWIDKTLLQLKEVESLQGADFNLSKEGEAWQDSDGNVAEQEEVDKLVNGLSGLWVTAAADDEATEALDDLSAPPPLIAKTRNGEEYLYRLYEVEDTHYVRRSDVPIYFELSAYDHDRLNDVNAASLFPVSDAGEEGDGEGDGAGDSAGDDSDAP